jgi:hypothetical protein
MAFRGSVWPYVVSRRAARTPESCGNSFESSATCGTHPLPRLPAFGIGLIRGRSVRGEIPDSRDQSMPKRLSMKGDPFRGGYI